MATGASNAELAVILIDARKGVLVQTRRHSLICSLLGIRHVVLAVNKIDLVDYRQDAFDRIVGDYSSFAPSSGFASVVPIPISARYGDNVIARSGSTPWYRGPTLLEHLETVDIASDDLVKAVPFSGAMGEPAQPRFPRLRRDRCLRPRREGDAIVVAASGQSSRIADIVTYDGDARCGAEAGDAVTLTLAEEVDIARGDVLVEPDCPARSRRPVCRASDLDGRASR